LAEQGAHNINLVTPTQYVPQIIRACTLARERGMTLPVVYNTSGYETPETIRALDGCVDGYLTDFKYASYELASRYSGAPEYPQVALSALEAMVGQVGEYVPDDEGILRSGVIVRHLMLPGQLEDSRAVLRLVFDSVGNRVCYSLMSQYTPLSHARRFPELQTTVTEDEYDALINFALDLGITNSFMQESAATDAADAVEEETFIPAFDLTGV
jgi:putative pyruvate formate lyase activating enzyme